MEQSKTILTSIIGIILVLALYQLTNNTRWWVDEEKTSVSLCQVHVQYDGSEALPDRTLLALLVALKMYDFQISQPVLGPSNILIYLCEHPLKTGLKQTIIDQELNNVIRNSGESSKRFSWSCA